MNETQIKPYLKRFHYNGKCNDYDEDGELVSSLFRDATEMSQATDEDNEYVLDLTYEQFILLLTHDYPVPKGLQYQININQGVAWYYNEDEDIHYFFGQ